MANAAAMGNDGLSDVVATLQEQVDTQQMELQTKEGKLNVLRDDLEVCSKGCYFVFSVLQLSVRRSAAVSKDRSCRFCLFNYSIFSLDDARVDAC